MLDLASKAEENDFSSKSFKVATHFLDGEF